MCGIGAILRTDGGPIEDAWLDILDRRIAPRGPDGSGNYQSRNQARNADGVAVALVHRRLAIIDLDDGVQPMCTADDGLAVVFNGCIYNHRELRVELEGAGHAFETDHSDTEVLLHAYRQWGERMVEHLEGMYAFALWDRKKGALALGRDWFGEKPLYAASVETDGGAIAIAASDARAVVDLQEHITKRPSGSGATWLRGFLRYGYGPGGLTPYEGDGARMGPVRAHPIGVPGDLGRDTEIPRWRVDSDPDAFAREVEDHLARAVESRLESDVPLGCFLSGGVDSSLIAHYARKFGPLRTFTVRMPDPRYDESAHAETVAQAVGSDHETIPLDEVRPAEDLVHLIERFGQPFGDSSILPTYWVSRAAAGYVKVALGGDGGDELFFGYDRYAGAAVLAGWQAPLRLLPRGIGVRAHAKSKAHRLGRLGRMARDWPRAGILAMESLFDGRQLDALLPDLPRDDIRAPDVPGASDPGDALRRLDLMNYLPGDLLTKVDTASMACPIEVRAPFLDRALVRLVAGAHPSLLRRGGRKGLLRDIARRHLPAAIVDRPKMGFAIPIGEWFRDTAHELHAMLVDHLQSAAPFGNLPVDLGAARLMMREHLDGHVNHDQRLFCLLTLAIWARMR